MGVARPRVRALDPGDKVTQGGRGRRPQPEGAVDVQPDAARAAGLGDLRQRVEGAGIDVPGLGADDRRAVAPVERRGERIGAHAPLAVGLDPRHPLGAEAQHLQNREDRDMRLVPHDHRDLGRAEQAAGLDVPAGAREQRVARRGEAGQVRHGTAGGETDARRLRAGKTEEIEKPAGGGPLDDGEGGRLDVHAGHLVPGRGQPVGGERRGQRAAGDEAEVTRAGRSGDAGIGVADQALDHRDRVLAVLRQRSVEGGERVDLDRRRDGTLGQVVDEVEREVGGAAQQRVVTVVHGGPSLSVSRLSPRARASAGGSRCPRSRARARSWVLPRSGRQAHTKARGDASRQGRGERGERGATRRPRGRGAGRRRPRCPVRAAPAR